MAKNPPDKLLYEEDEDTTGVDDFTVRKTYAKAQDLQSTFLIVLAGSKAGELCRIGNELIVGRATDVGFQLLDSGVSKHHLKLSVRGRRVVLEDLGSRNGTFVNGERVTSQILEDGDKIQIGSTAILKYSIADALEANFQQQMHEAATCDPLTGLFNRRRLIECLQAEFAYAARHDASLSLIMIDIDHFKALNDVHGHPVGDAALTAIGKQILRCIRREDLAARFGGEEFAVVCRGVSAAEAAVLAERLRERIETETLLEALPDVTLTISAGVAEGPSKTIGGADAIVAAADKALYEAKRLGRNRVCVAE